MKCHLIDSLPIPVDNVLKFIQKPIYDIPAYPEILAEELVEKFNEAN